jgi:hypothetical protein
VSVKPTLIAPATDLTPFQGAAVAYWSPTALNLNGVALPAGGSVSTPPLFCAGLDQFMMIGFQPLFPLTGSVVVTMANPEDDVSLGINAVRSAAGLPFLTFLITFGAFSTDFVDPAGPGDVPSGRALAYWVFRITFNNTDVDDTTITARLWGQRR